MRSAKLTNTDKLMRGAHPASRPTGGDDPEETTMRHKQFLTNAGLASVLTGLLMAAAQAQSPAALTGQVSSAEEGPMEGVLVSAKKDGSNITVTVVSDQKGEYSFPGGRLDPGHYTVSIRAADYDLDGPKTVDVSASGSKADIKLVKTKNLANQLANAEWLMSAPGPDTLKANMTNCVGCHTLQRVFASTHDSDEFKQVFQRMGTYSPGSTPMHPQPLLPGPRADRSPMPKAQFDAMSNWLAIFN
jgi:virginiamycin B lyase